MKLAPNSGVTFPRFGVRTIHSESEWKGGHGGYGKPRAPYNLILTREPSNFQESGEEVRRKNSVPENMSDVAELAEQQQRRRSTYDSATSTLSPIMAKLFDSGKVRMGVRDDYVQEIHEGNFPGSSIDDYGDDYMMMTPNPLLPPQRVISTIVESVSSSSPSSDHEGSETLKGEKETSKKDPDNGEREGDYGYIVNDSPKQTSNLVPSRKERRTPKSSTAHRTAVAERRQHIESTDGMKIESSSDYAELAPSSGL